LKNKINNIVEITGVKKTNGAINEALSIFKAPIQKIYEIPFTKIPFIKIGKIVSRVGNLNSEREIIEINEITVAVKK
jgi:hypothetical protein